MEKLKCQSCGTFFWKKFLALTLEILSCEQFDELKDQVAIEQILRVVFLDPERPTPVSVIDVSLTWCQYLYL